MGSHPMVLIAMFIQGWTTNQINFLAYTQVVVVECKVQYYVVSVHILVYLRNTVLLPSTAHGRLSTVNADAPS